jgi:hypothetical protein
LEIINSKYYEGYEGEGEIQFIRYLSNGDKYIIRIWDGFFDEIMSGIQPEENGWIGLAYYYHIKEPWWEQPWKIPDIEIVLKQLQEIKVEFLNVEVRLLHSELCEILSNAWRLNESVWIADE